MKYTKDNAENSYEQQESQLSDYSSGFIKMLTKRGLIEDQDINDKKVRQVEKMKKRNMYHNTLLMLQNYRNIVWAMECFPANLADELGTSLKSLDALLYIVSDEIDFDNAKLESRLKNVHKSRLLLERVNDALTLLKHKPGNGELMYEIIYETYIIPEVLTHAEILYRVCVSSRHYYRLRQQAINILSLRLWSAPTGELDAWLEALTLLETL